jgi:hypothetical protein
VEYQEYDLVEEPKGQLYRQLLFYALLRCDSMSLVLRPGLGLTETGEEFLALNKAYVQSAGVVSKWPGTELVGGVAIIIYFVFCEPLVQQLVHFSQGLYQWVQPHLLEDLCLYRGNEPWLVSVAHEKIGWLRLGEQERSELITALPELVLASQEKPQSNSKDIL